jgi:hypothetical protein
MREPILTFRPIELFGGRWLVSEAPLDRHGPRIDGAHTILEKVTSGPTVHRVHYGGYSIRLHARNVFVGKRGAAIPWPGRWKPRAIAMRVLVRLGHRIARHTGGELVFHPMTPSESDQAELPEDDLDPGQGRR